MDGHQVELILEALWSIHGVVLDIHKVLTTVLEDVIVEREQEKEDKAAGLGEEMLTVVECVEK